MTTLPNLLYRCAAPAMIAVVFAVALLVAPGTSSTSWAKEVSLTAATDRAYVGSTEQPSKPHKADDCIVCSHQMLFGALASEHQTPTAFLISLPPVLHIVNANGARAPPFVERHAVPPTLSFESRGPPSVS